MAYATTQLKVQTFQETARRGVKKLEKQLQNWLGQNQNIEVVSTDFCNYGDNVAYIVIYREETIHQEANGWGHTHEDQREEPVHPGDTPGQTATAPRSLASGFSVSTLFNNPDDDQSR